MVILTDKHNNQVGSCEKLEAHEKGLLHRAFSIVVFNSSGDILLQKRSLKKYHSGGLWANTCCSHPRPGEKNLDAAHRRLKEELGFDCDLSEVFNFYYKVSLDNNMIEHEIDHVIIGDYFGKDINPDVNEVSDFKFVGIKDLLCDIEKNSDNYVYWLREIIVGLSSRGLTKPRA